MSWCKYEPSEKWRYYRHKKSKEQIKAEQDAISLETDINTFMNNGNLCIRRKEIEFYTNLFKKKGIKTTIRDLAPKSRKCVIIERKWKCRAKK